jgi:hypothetical protein
MSIRLQTSLERDLSFNASKPSSKGGLMPDIIGSHSHHRLATHSSSTKTHGWTFSTPSHEPLQRRERRAAVTPPCNCGLQ